MTAEEKLSLALFLDTAGDFFRDGYHKPREPSAFTDDPEKASAAEKVTDTVTRPSPEALGVEKVTVTVSDTLEAVAADIVRCVACPLHGGRSQAVPGEGVERPLVMVIGEGPGADEDASGRPFVGKAGQLLDKMLGSVGLSREKNCFIANVVKCRPPDNRDPLVEETESCAPFLARQIRLLEPRIILCAGRVAAQTLLKTGSPIGSLRGQFTPYHVHETLSIPVLATYHPSALLRDDTYKRPAWEDLKLLRQRLIEIDESYAREAGEGGV
ncbi:uracil-DNA glycosylase [Treponema primitia]|nr:uracil-DNA glycosylase [Treponema primitia]